MKTMTRIRRGAEEWRKIFADWAASGQTQADFCRDHGIGYSTFQKWKRTLDVEGPSAATTESAKSSVPLFAEVAWPTEEPASGGAGQQWDIELQLGPGICLRIRQSA